MDDSISKGSYLLPEWVSSRRAEGRVLLYDADTGEIYYLDGSGPALWAAMRQMPVITLEGVVAAMVESFGDAAAAQIRSDLCELMEDLVERRLLLPLEPSP